MELQGVYSIYDNAAQAYLRPFFMDGDALAQRLFADCCADTTHQFNKHAADFTLFRIADFDQHSAKSRISKPSTISATPSPFSTTTKRSTNHAWHRNR